MSAMTDAFENKLVDHFFRSTALTRLTDILVHLYTATPGETGGGTEVTGGSYAAVSLPPLDTNWYATQGGISGASSGTGGATSNAVQITYPTPSANWGSIQGVALKDNTGLMMFYAALTTAKTVNNGDPAPYFPTTSLAVTFA